MNENSLHDVPTLQIGFNDLAVLRSIVRGYLAVIRRAVSPSQERQRQILVLEGVYQRLVGIPRSTAVLHFPLTQPEIYALNSAMLGFAAFVRQKVPASGERDETLKTLEQLRHTLLGILVPQA